MIFLCESGGDCCLLLFLLTVNTNKDEFETPVISGISSSCDNIPSNKSNDEETSPKERLAEVTHRSLPSSISVSSQGAIPKTDTAQRSSLSASKPSTSLGDSSDPYSNAGTWQSDSSDFQSHSSAKQSNLGARKSNPSAKQSNPSAKQSNSSASKGDSSSPKQESDHEEPLSMEELRSRRLARFDKSNQVSSGDRNPAANPHTQQNILGESKGEVYSKDFSKDLGKNFVQDNGSAFDMFS